MKKIYLLLLAIMMFAGGIFAQANISNYTFNTVTGATYTPITGGTVAFTGLYDNSVTTAVTMGGTFPFGGANQTTCFISTNGFITFGAGSTTLTYTPMSTLGTTTGAIAAFAQDAAGSEVSGAAPEIRYQNLGTEFVVQFKDHSNYYNRSTERLNFQIRLNYSTGAINIVYGTCTNPGSVSTTQTTPQVGIRGNSVTWTTNVNSLLVGNVPAATTCDWASAVSSFANTSTMLFSGTTNANVKIPVGLTYTWTPPVAATLAPVRTFAAVTAITTSAATLGWTAVTAATAYNIRYRIPGTCTWTSFSGNPVSTNAATLTGLVSATTYQIQVQSSDGTNNSIWSNIPTSAAGSGLNGYVATGTFTTLANVCTGTPTAGTVAPTTQNVCPAITPANLVLTGFTTGATGITFQWEQASDFAFTIASNAVGGTGATTSTYTPPAFVGTNIYYRCKVTCTGSSLSANSNVTSVLAPAVPSTQASAIVVIPSTTTATINWTSGSGGRRYVVVNTTNSFTDPSGTADQTGVTSVYTSGEVKVYDGTASSVSITGLVQGTPYFVRVYEYQRCTGMPNVNYYNTTTAANNPNTFTTLTPPVNDLICGALELTVNDPVAVCTNTTAATVTVSDPDINFCSTANNTVWYKFTPTVSGIHNIIGSVPTGSLDGQNSWIHIFTATGTCPGALTLTAAGGLSCSAAPASAVPGTTTTVSTTALVAGTTYYIFVDGNSGDFGDMCLRVVGPGPMAYVSSTTTQPTSTSASGGSTNQNIIRLEVTVTGSTTPLSMSQIDFNTIGSTAPADITNARVFYTGTSTTFATTTPFGIATPNPSGNFSAIGTQVLSGGLGNTVNYFWLAYDVSCTATAANVLDAECTSFNIGTGQIPTVTAPTGNRAVTSFVSPVVSTSQPSTAIVSPGGVNNQVLQFNLPASSCLSSITQLDFSNTNISGDITKARVFYTTSPTFSSAIQYGADVNAPGTTFSVTGTQTLATSGTLYFWLVYDLSCSATVGSTIDAGLTSLISSLGTITPTTANPTGTRTITAATSFTTIANGEWSNAATWACGAIPLTNTTPVTIAHNIIVSTAGNIAGSVNINSGSSLTIVAGGDLTLGTIGGGNRILTNDGTLAVTGGTLNQNGSIVNNSTSVFNQSGGNINIDGNAAGVIANSVASGVAILQFNQVNTGINLTGGTLTIVDPHANTTSSNSIGVNNAAVGSQTSTVNHTLRLGDGVSTDAGGNVIGFNIDNWTGSTYLSFGNIIINGSGGTNRNVNSVYQLAAAGDVTVTANSTLISGSSLVVGRDLTINASGTFTGGASTGGLAMALVTSNTGTALTFGASSVPQSITNNGTMSNLSATPTANLVLFLVQNSNPAGVTLNSPISVSGTLNMTLGRINTTTANLLTLGFNGVSAANAGGLTYVAGHIFGPFKRWINAATGPRQFPVGNGTVLKNASINYTTVPTTPGSLTAVWSPVAPSFPNASPLMQGALIVNKVSTQGSWFIDAGDGIAGGAYTGTFTPNASPDVIDFSKTVLVKRPSAGGDWTLDGTHVTTTGSNAAPTLSRTGMANFSEFAIGGELNGALPITIDYLKGTKQTNGNVLDWKITCNAAPTVVIELQRSGDARNFKAINVETVTDARCQQPFTFTDVNPTAGVNYYRLKTTEPNGAVKYSNIIALINKDKGFEIVSLAPNPARDFATLSLATAKAGRVDIIITDVVGKVIAKQNNNLVSGNNTINMNFAKYAAGTYTIAVTNADGEIKTTRFVKY